MMRTKSRALNDSETEKGNAYATSGFGCLCLDSPTGVATEALYCCYMDGRRGSCSVRRERRRIVSRHPPCGASVKRVVRKGVLQRGSSSSSVVCDESGHTKLPFWYLAHVILLTLAQIQLSLCSGFTQVGSPLLALITIFGWLNHFNSSRGGLELIQYIKITKVYLKVGKLRLKFGTAAGNC